MAHGTWDDVFSWTPAIQPTEDEVTKFQFPWDAQVNFIR